MEVSNVNGGGGGGGGGDGGSGGGGSGGGHLEHEPDETWSGVQSRLSRLGYPDAKCLASLDAFVFPGEARYRLLEWLFARYDPGIFDDCDLNQDRGETARALKLASIASVLGLCGTNDIHTIRGAGGKVEQQRFLDTLVSLVELESELENREGKSIDEQTLVDSQLLDVVTNNQSDVFSVDVNPFSTMHFAHLVEPKKGRGGGTKKPAARATRSRAAAGQTATSRKERAQQQLKKQQEGREMRQRQKELEDRKRMEGDDGSGGSETQGTPTDGQNEDDGGGLSLVKLQERFVEVSVSVRAAQVELARLKEQASAVQEAVDTPTIARTRAGLELRSQTTDLKDRLGAFNATFANELQSWVDELEPPVLSGLGPTSSRILSLANVLKELMDLMESVRIRYENVLANARSTLSLEGVSSSAQSSEGSEAVEMEIRRIRQSIAVLEKAVERMKRSRTK